MPEPFLKWLGGKRKLLPKLREHFPEKIDIYIEPFVGAGSVLLDVVEKYHPQKIVVSDKNKMLISCYIAIRDSKEELISALRELRDEYYACGTLESKREFYNSKKREFNSLKKEDIIASSSLVMFLNKTCYCGLFRFNSKGEFNSSYRAHLSETIFKEDNIRKLSSMFECIEILNEDFETVIDKHADDGAFIYCDPPYYKTFDSYNASGFSPEDHLRLMKCLKRHEKCSAMISNSYIEGDDFIEKIYYDFYIQKINSRRGVKYGKDSLALNELIITNYETMIYDNFVDL